MEWINCIRKTIDYIEFNLKDEILVQNIANEVGISALYLQQGFSCVTGSSIFEYVRGRRLYQAALDIQETDAKIIDIALDYGYETAESFTKAFSKFHGVSPSMVRQGAPIKVYVPFKVRLEVQGGNQMNCKIAKMFGFKVIGFEKVFSSETSYEEIPKFWDEICEKYANNIYQGNAPQNDFEQAIIDNCIGEYGVCIDDMGENKFRYLIAGKYTGGKVPEGMTLYEFPSCEWAVFDCIGALPEALQTVNTRIFKEWLPGNEEFELCGNSTVEWYDCINGEKTDPDYHSAIWIPVKRK